MLFPFLFGPRWGSYDNPTRLHKEPGHIRQAALVLEGFKSGPCDCGGSLRKTHGASLTWVLSTRSRSRVTTSS